MDPNAIATQPIISLLDAGIFVSSVDYGYKTIALKLISGTVTYQSPANLPLQGVDPPSAQTQPAITLDAQGFFMTAENPIDGLTVDATLGVVEIAVTK
jgi:hypothetical protein